MAVKFDTIITHERTHLDEYLAIFLLRKFGEERFPGISKAKIVYWNSGGQSPNGRSASDYEKEGVLLIGVGGGRGSMNTRPLIETGKKMSVPRLLWLKF